MSRSLVALWLGSALVAALPAAAALRPIAGLWEGVLHGGRRDQPAALVLLPRGAGSFGGMVYVDGQEFGPIEDGRVAGDSLSFKATNYPFLGRIEGGALALTLVIPHGSTHGLELTHTSADTTALPAAVLAARTAAPPAAIPRDVAPDSVFAAHALPADAAPGTAPCLRHGTLLLAGGGPGQDDLNARFVQLAGGASARIVAIPTAHVTAADSPAALAEYARDFKERLGVARVDVLHTYSRREADSDAFVKPLESATGVWIDGGEAMDLLNAYMGTRTERELIALLDRGGVIGGTSAGALIWGSRSMVFRAHPGAKSYEIANSTDLLIGQVHESDLGVVQDALIAPHFTEFRIQPALVKMLAAYPRLLAFGIDEATALEVHDDTCTVLGRGAVQVFRGSGEQPLFVLHDGARFDIRRLKVI